MLVSGLSDKQDGSCRDSVSWRRNRDGTPVRKSPTRQKHHRRLRSPEVIYLHKVDLDSARSRGIGSLRPSSTSHVNPARSPAQQARARVLGIPHEMIVTEADLAQVMSDHRLVCLHLVSGLGRRHLKLTAVSCSMARVSRCCALLWAYRAPTFDDHPTCHPKLTVMASPTALLLSGQVPRATHRTAILASKDPVVATRGSPRQSHLCRRRS
jgi:hypothetical protein